MEIVGTSVRLDVGSGNVSDPVGIASGIERIKSETITIGHTCNCTAIMRCSRVDFEIRSPRIT